MKDRMRRTILRPRSLAIALLIAVVIVGGFTLLGSGNEVDPSLDYPHDVSKAEQVEFLMREHLVTGGLQVTHRFVLYVENAPEDIRIHKGG